MLKRCCEENAVAIDASCSDSINIFFLNCDVDMKKVSLYLYRKWMNNDWLDNEVIHPDTGNRVKIRTLPKKYRDRFRPRRPNQKYIDRSNWLNKFVVSPLTGNKVMVRSLPLRYRNVYRPDDSPVRDTTQDLEHRIRNL